jgi:hypothetical protein
MSLNKQDTKRCDDSPYDPVRRMRRDHFYKAAVALAREGFVTGEGWIAGNLPDIILKDLITPAVRCLYDADGSVDVATLENLLRLRQWVPTYGQHHLCGNQVFDMGSPLLDIFEKTSIKDTSLGDVELPYNGFYLYFGQRQRLSSEWGRDEGGRVAEHEYIDGAYISKVDMGEERFRLKIGFSMCREDGSPIAQNGPIVDFLPEELSMEVGAGVDAALSRRIKEIDEDARSGSAVDGEDSLSEFRTRTYREMYTLFGRAIELVVNCLYYLEVVGSAGLMKSPSRNTPQEVEAGWQGAKLSKNDNKVCSAAKKVRKAGGSFVYMLGHHIDRSSLNLSDSSSEMGLHWRRGHKRNQPYGPGRSLRKKIRIAPVLVRADLLLAGGELADPHVYSVDLTSSVMY